MAERSMAPVLKTGNPARGSRVRIPVPPLATHCQSLPNPANPAVPRLHPPGRHRPPDCHPMTPVAPGCTPSVQPACNRAGRRRRRPGSRPPGGSGPAAAGTAWRVGVEAGRLDRPPPPYFSRPGRVCVFAGTSRGFRGRGVGYGTDRSSRSRPITSNTPGYLRISNPDHPTRGLHVIRHEKEVPTHAVLADDECGVHERVAYSPSYRQPSWSSPSKSCSWPRGWPCGSLCSTT